ncbi:MAG: hypothetical protein OEU91_02925 [Gammaproteobacteria bacterium]|nr:hypothetical protein [Gammaproteobacteria bacterium]
MKRLILFPLGGMTLLLVALALLLASNLYTYYRLTSEAPIAELSFRQLAPQQYLATIAYGDFCDDEQYTLHGDQWRLDAQFLKWRPWANLLGLDALYRIERLGGRYLALGQENAGPHRAHSLSPAQRVDLPAVLARYDGALSPVDTLYGSSVYDSMDENVLYRVYRGQSGLLVRRVPEPAIQAAGGLTIDINRACEREFGLLQRILRPIRLTNNKIKQ